MLRALLANIVTTEDMLETGLRQDMFDVPSVDMDFHIAPSLGLDFRQIALKFLPHELEDFGKLTEKVGRKDLLAVAERDQFDGFGGGELQVPGVRRCEARKHRYGASYEHRAGRNRAFGGRKTGKGWGK